MQNIQLNVDRIQSSMVKAEHTADILRSQWAVAYLRPLRNTTAAADAERAAQKAARARKHYAEHRIQETERTRRYKLANPQRKRAMDALRNARIHAQADGSATPKAIRKLKALATHCAYCGTWLFSKQTDHLIPLVLGGEHSAKNLAIVCQDCNQRKHALSYVQWIARVDPRHRARVIALFEARYGMEQPARAAA